MIRQVQEPVKTTPLAELRTIWIDALGIFLRKFNFLNDEIATATWRRFFVTILTALIVSSGLYHVALGFSYQGIYEKQLHLAFNFFGYWLVETLWTVITGAVNDIPVILLVAYLSYYWVSHTKDEHVRWLQEAQTLAITWVITIICVQALVLLEGAVREALFNKMPIMTRTVTEHRYTPIINYLFDGLLTALIIAYRYNLLLHGNKILNGISSHRRWLLLGFQFISLEAGTLLVSHFLLNLPVILDLHQTLTHLWIL